MLKFNYTDKVLVLISVAGVLSLAHLYLKHFNTKKIIVVNEKNE